MARTIQTGASKQFTTLPKLTIKEKAFVKGIKENPKLSVTEIANRVYDVKNRRTATSIAHENLTKPHIISHLEAYNDIVEETLTSTIIDYSKSDNIKQRTLAVDTSKYIHDKIHGKATIRTENTNLNINIEALLNSM